MVILSEGKNEYRFCSFSEGGCESMSDLDEAIIQVVEQARYVGVMGILAVRDTISPSVMNLRDIIANGF